MATTVTLRALDLQADLAALLALQHRCAPAAQHWDRSQAIRELTDIGRGYGANVVVADRGDAIVGVAGWVSLEAAKGEFYGAPVISDEPEVLAQLVARVESEATAAGAAWLRIMSWLERDAKLAVLAARGYRAAFQFVELAGAVAELSPSADTMPAELRQVALDEVAPDAIASLFNDTFRDVPNCATKTVPMIVEVLEDPALLPEATQLWVDGEGVCQAFSLTERTGYIDSFGVRAAYRRRGVAGAMLARTIAAARSVGLTQLTSTVADMNNGSLAVHRRAGFHEQSRTQTWQLPLR